MAFNLEALMNKVKDYQSKSSGDGKFPKTVFLPEGNHKGRFIVDPNGELFTEYYSIGYFNKGIRDPRGLPQEALPAGFKDYLSDVVEELREYKYKFSPKRTFLVWFYLEETQSVEKDKWEPGNLYCIIGNARFAKAFLQFVQSIGEAAPQELQKMLTPSESSVQLQIISTAGSQGSVAISPTFPQKTSNPIDVSKHVYVSLEEAYIRPGFNQEKYNALYKEYREELDKLVASGAKKMSEEEDQQEIPNQAQGSTPTAPEAQPQAQPQPQPSPQPAQVETQQPVAQEATPPAENPTQDDPWAKFRKQSNA